VAQVEVYGMSMWKGAYIEDESLCNWTFIQKHSYDYNLIQPRSGSLIYQMLTFSKPSPYNDALVFQKFKSFDLSIIHTASSRFMEWRFM